MPAALYSSLFSSFTLVPSSLCFPQFKRFKREGLGHFCSPLILSRPSFLLKFCSSLFRTHFLSLPFSLSHQCLLSMKISTLYQIYLSKRPLALKLPLFHWSLFFQVLSIFIIHMPSQTPGYSGFLPPFPNIPRRVGIKEKRKFEGGQGSPHCPNT